MNWQTILVAFIIVGAFFLLAKKGSCCGTKNSGMTKNPNEDKTKDKKKEG